MNANDKDLQKELGQAIWATSGSVVVEGLDPLSRSMLDHWRQRRNHQGSEAHALLTFAEEAMDKWIIANFHSLAEEQPEDLAHWAVNNLDDVQLTDLGYRFDEELDCLRRILK